MKTDDWLFSNESSPIYENHPFPEFITSKVYPDESINYGINN